jgi:hypothetical protein
VLTSEPEQGKKAEEATQSELLGEPSTSDPPVISLSTSSFGRSPRSIDDSYIARFWGSFSEIDASVTCESLVVASL